MKKINGQWYSLVGTYLKVMYDSTGEIENTRLIAAEKKLKKRGFKTKRIVLKNSIKLYSRKKSLSEKKNGDKKNNKKKTKKRK